MSLALHCLLHGRDSKRLHSFQRYPQLVLTLGHDCQLFLFFILMKSLSHTVPLQGRLVRSRIRYFPRPAMIDARHLGRAHQFPLYILYTQQQSAVHRIDFEHLSTNNQLKHPSTNDQWHQVTCDRHVSIIGDRTTCIHTRMRPLESLPGPAVLSRPRCASTRRIIPLHPPQQNIRASLPTRTHPSRARTVFQIAVSS